MAKSTQMSFRARRTGETSGEEADI